MGRVEPLFFDKLIQYYSKEYTEQQTANSELHDGISKLIRGGGIAALENTELLQEINSAGSSSKTEELVMKRHIEILSNARLFLLNGAVVDSLYHLPAAATNYDAINHRPFPVIFFELMDTIDVRVLSGRNADLKGILFGNADIASPLIGTYAVNKDPERFGVSLFYGHND